LELLIAFIKGALEFLGEFYQTFWVFLSRCFVCDFPPGTLGCGIGSVLAIRSFRMKRSGSIWKTPIL
jgi:hypothetical protein